MWKAPCSQHDMWSLPKAVLRSGEESSIRPHVHLIQWIMMRFLAMTQPKPAHSIERYDTSFFTSSQVQRRCDFFVAVPNLPWATISIGRRTRSGDSITVATKWEWYLKGSPMQVLPCQTTESRAMKQRLTWIDEIISSELDTASYEIPSRRQTLKNATSSTFNEVRRISPDACLLSVPYRSKSGLVGIVPLILWSSGNSDNIICWGSWLLRDGWLSGLCDRIWFFWARNIGRGYIDVLGIRFFCKLHRCKPSTILTFLPLLESFFSERSTVVLLRSPCFIGDDLLPEWGLLFLVPTFQLRYTWPEMGNRVIYNDCYLWNKVQYSGTSQTVWYHFPPTRQPLRGVEPRVSPETHFVVISEGVCL